MLRSIGDTASRNRAIIIGRSMAGLNMNGNNNSPLQAEEDVKRDRDVKSCSTKQVCAICAFFLMLTVLALYVMFAYPQTGY